MRSGAIFLLFIFVFFFSSFLNAQPKPACDLNYKSIPTIWDEGIPLGNGMLGAMIWQKGDKLRFSLDRADVWDLSTIREFDLSEWNYSWVYQQWLKPSEYMTVQQLFDLPYERDASPTKIPSGALEFPLATFGEVESVRLSVKDAVCEINWKNGVKLISYINATDAVGVFNITGLKAEIKPELIIPKFQTNPNSDRAPRELERLDYPLPKITKGKNSIVIHQLTFNGSYYDMAVRWKYEKGKLSGTWSISVSYPGEAVANDAVKLLDEYSSVGTEKKYAEHLEWWKKFWAQSSVNIPDTTLQKQYYREIYKMGCISRKDAPAASLQAIWTSDNGKLPPWKNDFHNDLNTQMTYWPCYTSNHLAESSVFTDWLWNYKPVAEKYTRKYFGADGLNFPGVSALNGYPLGGWIQYAFSTTTSCWLSQHFYWQWKYSMDKKFLENRAYPWIKEVGNFIEKMSFIIPDSSRIILMSSSPEVYDNSEKAWFKKNTNYDVMLIQSLYSEAFEMADALSLKEDKARWQKDLEQWSRLAIDTVDSSLLLAPGIPLDFSHRHFSHLMSIYPLGLLDPNRSVKESTIVKNSLDHIKKLGTKEWCGYSFAWYAALLARNGNGNEAVEALKTFATAFTTPNSFHTNGDQSGKAYSNNTSRIMTLEGNMGFAAALQEMLLQSYQGVIRIFPAVPDEWKTASFINLRAEGAFVVTAVRDKGLTRKVMVISEKGGMLRIMNPFKSGTVAISGTQDYTAEGKILVIPTAPGQIITLETK